MLKPRRKEVTRLHAIRSTLDILSVFSGFGSGAFHDKKSRESVGLYWAESERTKLLYTHAAAYNDLSTPFRRSRITWKKTLGVQRAWSVYTGDYTNNLLRQSGRQQSFLGKSDLGSLLWFKQRYPKLSRRSVKIILEITNVTRAICDIAKISKENVQKSFLLFISETRQCS